MMRLCLTLEYDGTAYHGWQIQPNVSGQTIQAVLEDAIQKIVRHPVRLHSSGRTDAGVHAQDMKAHFDTNSNLPLSAYCHGVNAHLPADIVVREVVRVDSDFHARFDAQKKHYRYSIYTGRMRSPLKRWYSWHVSKNLDLSLMRQGAELLVGKHDFSAFRSSSCVAESTVRTVESAGVTLDGEHILFDVVGDGFLKNMVRIMVGVLYALGTRKMSLGDVGLMLKTGERPLAAITAPACGLCLMQVYYEIGTK